MSNRVLKLGFIGGSINSAIGATHKIASQMDGHFQLVAGCFSRKKIINKKTACLWHAERHYDTFKEFLTAERGIIDAVVILTPTSVHTEVIIEAIKHDIPVICEKTLTNNVDDALKIKKVLKKNNSFLVTTYNYTGYPMVRELENMILKGKLGEIAHIKVQMPQESFMRLNKKGEVSTPQSWRLEDKSIPTLSLDLGTHLSNMLSFLTKEKPLEVIAMQNSFGHHDVIDNLTCLVKYSNNIDCQMWFSKSALGHKNGLKVEIYGTEGSVSWYQMEPEFLRYNDNLGRNILIDRSSKDIEIADQARYNRFKSGHPAGFIEAFANHYEDIYTELVEYRNSKNNFGNRYVFNIDDALNDLGFMEAIEKSIKSRKWENINVEN